METKTKIRASELAFVIGYIIYIFYRLLFSSAYQTLFGNSLRQILKLSSIIILVLAFFLNHYVSRKSFRYTICFVLIGAITYYYCGSIDIICLALLLTSSYRVKFETIIKTSLVTNVFLMVCIFMGCRVGVIPDYCYQHYSIVSRSWETVHSYGYLHYSTPAFIILYISMMILYFKRKPIIFFILLGMNFVSFIIFTAKLPIFIYAITGLLLIFFRDKFYLNKLRKKSRFLWSLTPYLGGILSFGICTLYNSGSVFWSSLNVALSNRLSQGNMAISKNGVYFFGSVIEMGGVYSYKYGALKGLDISNYFFVDNDFLMLLIHYGIAMSLIVLFLYSSIIKYSMEEENKFIFIWCLITMLFAFVNSILLNIEYNPLLFLGFKYVVELSNNRLKVRRIC